MNASPSSEPRSSRVGVLLAVLGLVLAGSLALRFLAPERGDSPPLPPPPERIEGTDYVLQARWVLGQQVTDMQSPRDGTGRLFVAEQAGRIRRIEGGELVREAMLDIGDRVNAGGERGLLGMAYGDDFRSAGHFYVYYTAEPDGRTVVSRFTLEPGATVADPATEHVLLEIPQPYSNHNAGQLHFGPAGNLWIATGDGGSGGDPEDRAENTDDLLGKLLRIDIREYRTTMAGTEAERSEDGRYVLPADNAFPQGNGGRPEIWAYGLRNPWRFSFDPATRDLWVADVGQAAWEEVNRVSWAVGSGVNFGWNTMEGSHCFQPEEGCDTTKRWLPTYEYSHDDGCSVTGGVVYRGTDLPELDGVYLFSDYCSGWIRGLRAQPRQDPRNEDEELVYAMETVFEPTGLNISSFAVDAAGEVYVLDLGGTIYALRPR